MWRSRSCTVIGRFGGTRSSLPPLTIPTFWSANSGMNLATGSPSRRWPSSTSAMTATETIGLVIEKIRKIESSAIGVDTAGLWRPSASNQPTWPRRATSTVIPGTVPLSISRLKASDIAWRRGRDRPSVSGLASGKGGVFGAVAGLRAAVAVMVTPGGTLLSGAKCGPEGAAQTSEAGALLPCNPAVPCA
ncbi:hypothetical protein ACVIQT_007120 [Bradyrhizobium diazoefficiens]